MRRALIGLLAVVAAAIIGHGAQAAAGPSYPAASQPLGNTADVVLLYQGAGCPSNAAPCATVTSPSVRFGQPIQLTCSTVVSPFQYQHCIDTSLSPPQEKEYIGTTWWPLWILNGSTGPSLALTNFSITNLTVAGTLSVGGAASFTGGLTANSIIDTALSISSPVCTGTGQQLITCGSGPGSGTVTSVALSLPVSVFTITGSPVTSSGTLTGSFANQTANYVFAGPSSGGAAPPTFRAMVAADCVLPTTSSVGCVEAINAISHEWINSINSSGIPQLSQPAFTDISGTAGAAQGGTGLNTSSSSGVPIISAGTWAITAPITAQGRLTLTSHTPVLTTTTTNAGVIYYDAYIGNMLSIYNGTSDVTLQIGSNEISDTLEASSTGEVLSGGVFDEWAVNVSGVAVICHATNGSGGGWASDSGGSNTARGTGYSKLDNHTRSYPTNANSITNCYNGATQDGPISANQATYLGTFYTTANGQTGVSFGGSASGGTAGCACLWNYYNRRLFQAQVIDSGSPYIYGSSTVRQARASAGNEASFVLGAQEDGVTGGYMTETLVAATSFAQAGFGLDTTTAFTGQQYFIENVAGSSASLPASATIMRNVGVGFHTISANEGGNTSASQTFDTASTNELDVSLWY